MTQWTSRKRAQVVELSMMVLGAGMAVTAMARAQSGAPVRPPVPGAPAAATAFVDVAVVPMDTDRLLPHQTVVVEHGWITAMGPVKQVKIPAGAMRIDGQGKYLIPGMSDMHIHVPSFHQMNAQPIDAPFSAEGTWEAEQQLFLELANGVTRARVMNGRPGVVALRDRAERGEILSPRLSVGTPSIGNWLSPDSAVRLIETAKRVGYDFVKIYSADSVWDSTVAAAQRVGLALEGHVPSDGRGVDAAIRAGYRSIEHLLGYEAYFRRRDPAFYVDADYLTEIAKDSVKAAGLALHTWSASQDAELPALVATLRERGIWSCPTMVTNFVFFVNATSEEWWAVTDGSDRYARRRASDTLPPVTAVQLDSLFASVATKEAVAPTVQFYRRIIKGLYDGGVKLLLGTDAGTGVFTPVAPGFLVPQELTELVGAGLRPYDALVIATRNAAEFAGEGAVAGVVGIGRRADLVLVNGNPLENVRHTSRPAGVMIGGRWLDRATIDARLKALTHTLGAPANAP